MCEAYCLPARWSWLALFTASFTTTFACTSWLSVVSSRGPAGIHEMVNGPLAYHGPPGLAGLVGLDVPGVLSEVSGWVLGWLAGSTGLVPAVISVASDQPSASLSGAPFQNGPVGC